MESSAREVFLTAVKAGNRPSVAAQFAGLSPKTVSEWLRRGKGLDGRPASRQYVEFVEDVERAQAEAEVFALSRIRKAMSRDWRAAAWYLENVSPDWRRRRDRSTPEPQAPVSRAPVGETVLVPVEALGRIGLDWVRAERGEVEIDDETRARRARLVTSNRSRST